MTNLNKSTWLNAESGLFAFPSVAPALWMRMETQIWKPTGWIIKQQADRRTHRDFHVFSSGFHLLVGGGRRRRRGEEKEKKKKNDTEVQLGRSGFQQITGCLCERWKKQLGALCFREQKHGYSLWKRGLKRRMCLHRIWRVWRGRRLRWQQTADREERHNHNFLPSFVLLTNFLQTRSFCLKFVLHDWFSLKICFNVPAQLK